MGGGEIKRKNNVPIMSTVAKGWPHRSPLLWSVCYTAGSQDRNLGWWSTLLWCSLSLALFEYTVGLLAVAPSGVSPQHKMGHLVTQKVFLSLRPKSFPGRIRAEGWFQTGSGERSIPRMKLRALWRSSDFCLPPCALSSQPTITPSPKTGLDVKRCTCNKKTQFSSAQK